MEENKHRAIRLNGLIFIYGLASYALFSFMQAQPDTPSYVAALSHLGDCTGDSPTDRLYRLSKPLALLLPWLASGLCSAPALMIAQQALAYILGAWAWLAVLRQLGFEPRSQTLGLMLLLGAQPWAVYGLLPLTDMLGWAATLGLWALLLRWQDRLDLGRAALWGLALAAGLWLKESVLVAACFFGAQLLLSPYTWPRRLALGLAALSGFVPLLALQIGLTEYCYGRSLWSWIRFSQRDLEEVQQSGLKALLMQGYRSLDVLWFLILGAAWSWKGLPKPLKISALGSLLAWLSFPFIWHYHSDRILFMLSLGLLPWAVWTLQKRPPRSAYALAFLTGVLNLGTAYGIYAWQIPGLIHASALIFLGTWFVISRWK